jgi:hypothetical protein
VLLLSLRLALTAYVDIMIQIQETPTTPHLSYALASTAYCVDLAIDVGCTCAIAGRLWYLGNKYAEAFGDSSSTRRTPSISNRYIKPIVIFVESGAIAAAVGIVSAVVFMVNSAASDTTLFFSAQLLVRTDPEDPLPY